MNKGFLYFVSFIFWKVVAPVIDLFLFVPIRFLKKRSRSFRRFYRRITKEDADGMSKIEKALAFIILGIGTAYIIGSLFFAPYTNYEGYGEPTVICNTK